MRNLWKSVLGLCVIGMGLGVSASAQAASGVGPYYATPSWDQTLPASTRFIVLTNMSSEAVLDRETGLVWEKSPITAIANWFTASLHCMTLNMGGRTGWRLPTMQDLMSLVDKSASNPALPSGHPFTNVQTSGYWSATAHAADATLAWFVNFFNGGVGNFGKSDGTFYIWCVRGGQGSDAQ